MSVDNLAALKALTPSVGDSVEMKGYYNPGDGGGSTFYWRSTSTAPDNGGTVIQPAAGGTGRWFRDYSGPLNILWFGAVEGNVGNQQPVYVAAANEAIRLGGGTVYTPRGQFRITSAIPVSSALVSYEGDGQESIIRAVGCGAFIISFVAAFNDTAIRKLHLVGHDAQTDIAIYQPPVLNFDDRAYGLIIEDNLFEHWKTAAEFNCIQTVTIRHNWGQFLNSGFRFIGFCGSVNVTENTLVCGSASAADQYGILADSFDYTTNGGLLQPEALRIYSNSVFGFDRCIAIKASIYCEIAMNDIKAQLEGIVLDSVRSTTLVIGNYVEVDTVTASCGLRVKDQVTYRDEKIIIRDNHFLSDAESVEAIGVLVGSNGGTGRRNNTVIENNKLIGFKSSDIAVYGSGGLRIHGNDCQSTAVANSIAIKAIPANMPVYVSENVCASIIFDEAPALANGLLQLGPNVINGTTFIGATIDDQPWKSYTPTIVAQMQPPLPAAQAVFALNSARYKKIGKTVFMEADVTVTNAGAGTDDLMISLPVSPAAAFRFNGSGGEYGSTGRAVGAIVPAGGTTVHVRDVSSSSIVVTGNAVSITVTYEVP